MQSIREQNIGLHRTFYAVRFSPEIIAYLSGIIEALKRHGADVSWTRRDNIHLTLRYLGEITDEQLDLAKRLPGQEEALPGFDIGAQGLGAFPSLRNASVLWGGVGGSEPEDMQRLRHVQERAEEWARGLGLPPERRRYSPHITLGRVRRPGAGLRELINDLTVRDCQSAFCHVDRLLLIRSVAGRYETIAEWGLRNAD